MSSHRLDIGGGRCICALRRGIAVCAVCVVPAFSAATAHASFVLPNGSSAQAAKTVSASEYLPGQMPGKVVHGVNLFTGQPVYPVSLGSVIVRDKVTWPISLVYQGSSQAVVSRDNATTPTSWVGLGWSLQLPYVALAHNGTTTYRDDQFFCSLGPYGGGQLVPSSKESDRFFLAENPYVQIHADYGSGVLKGQIVRWVFLFPDGNRMVFGGLEDDPLGSQRRRTLLASGERVGVRSWNIQDSKNFVYRWDIQSFGDIHGRNSLEFMHQYVYAQVLPGKSYVREGYPQQIFWRDESEQMVDEFRFSLAQKDSSEYRTIVSGDDSVAFLQPLYETRYLKELDYRLAGRLAQKQEFRYFIPHNGALNHAAKRQLSEIVTTVYDRKNPGVKDKWRSWRFEYQPITADAPGLLLRAERPDGGADEYGYGRFNPTREMRQEPWRDTEIFSSGPLLIPTDQIDYWSRPVMCFENVCYEISRYVRPDSVRTVLNAYSNFGNRFHRAVFNPIGNYFVDRNRNTLDFSYKPSSKITPHTDVMPVENDLFVTDANFGSLKIYELQSDGNFDSVYAVAPVINADGKNDTTYDFKVAPGYVIRRRTVGNWSALDIYVRNDLGQWEKLDGTTSCGFSNQGGSSAARYGDAIRKANDENCIAFNDDKILIQTHANYFVAIHSEYDVITVYARNPEYTHLGDGKPPFIELTDPSLQAIPDLGPYGFPSQKKSGGVLYPNNFQETIENVTLFDDMMVIEAKENSKDDYFIWLEFDGRRFSPALVENIGNKNSSDVASFWVFPNYALAYDKQIQEIRAYKRDAGSLRQLRFNGELSYLNHNTQQRAVISASQNVFSISIVDTGNGRPVHWDNSDTTRYRTYLYQLRPGDTATIDRTEEIQPLLANGRISETNNTAVFRSYFRSLNPPRRCSSSSDCYSIEFIFTMDLDAGPEDSFLSFHDIDDNFTEGTHVINLLGESRPGRLMAYGSVGSGASEIDSLRNRARVRFAQFTGVGYGDPSDPWVVSETRTHSGIRSDASNILRYRFDYNADSAEFSSGTLLPQFRKVEVSRCDGRQKNCVATNSEEVVFGIDASFALNANEFRLQGRPLSETGRNAGGEIRTRNTYVYDAVSDTSRWPKAMWIVRLDTAKVWNYSSNNSERQQWIAYSDYDTLTGNALHQDIVSYGVARLNASSASVEENSAFPSQSTGIRVQNGVVRHVDGLGHQAILSVPRHSRTYVWPSQFPVGDSMATLVSAQKVVTDSLWPFAVVEDSLWLAPNLTPDSLQAVGANPLFNVAQGWYPHSHLWLNRFGQEEASVTYAGSSTESEGWTSIVREGKRSLPAAVFGGARKENSSSFMAENGPILGFIQPAANGWEFPPGCAFDSLEKRSGRYSLRINGSDYGPTINLHLRNVGEKRFGFVVSAWMRSKGDAPILTVERRNNAGEVVGAFHTKIPVGGTFKRGAWQRYEIVIGNDSLVGLENLFVGDSANGYLRIWAGNDVGQNDTVYVDDMVARPDDADFTLYTYEENGSLKTKTDSDHRLSTYEYDIYGQLIGIRDDRGRMFSEKSRHRIGENEVRP